MLLSAKEEGKKVRSPSPHWQFIKSCTPLPSFPPPFLPPLSPPGGNQLSNQGIVKTSQDSHILFGQSILNPFQTLKEYRSTALFVSYLDSYIWLARYCYCYKKSNNVNSKVHSVAVCREGRNLLVKGRKGFCLILLITSFPLCLLYTNHPHSAAPSLSRERGNSMKI